MKQLSIRLEDELHERVTKRADRELRSVNAIVSRLLELWLADEVDLMAVPTPPKDKQEECEQ